MFRLQKVSITLLASVTLMMAVAQSSQTAILFQQLQAPETTDRADAALREMARGDVNVRRYLAVNLPGFIGNGPGKTSSSNAWTNAVRLAGDLKIAEAVPQLGKWIGFDTGGSLTLGQWARLEYNPAAKALAQIGDPSVDALKGIIQSASPDDRELAILALSLIHSPKAKNALTQHQANEPNPDVGKLMAKTLEVWRTPSTGCSCETIQQAIADFNQINVGLTRQVVEQHKFVGGASLSSRDRTAYFYDHCPDIQLQVEFSRDSNVLGDLNYSPNDVITKLSALSLRNPEAN